MATDDRVIIAGAGPVGLVAALSLIRREIPVLVLEAEADLTIDLRAGSYHPPTIEILADLEVTDDMHQTGIVVPMWQYRDRLEGVVAEFDLGLLRDETPFPYRLHLEQHRLTSILRHHIEQHGGCDVRFGHAVAGLTQTEDHVTVTAENAAGNETFTGRWLIGADGGRSIVRKHLSIEFEGFTWPERFLVASTTVDLADFGYAFTAYVADPELWSAIFKVPDDGPPGLWRIAYPTDPDVPEANVLAATTIQENLVALLGHDIPYPLKYASTYRVHQRVAETFRQGRVMLAGDAAHINNPLGGFGLNGGIQDAANLAKKLAQVWLEGADDSLLDLYVRQRREVNIEYVQAQSIRNKRLMEERDPSVRKSRNAEMAATALDPARAKAHLMNTSMINSVRRAAAIT